MRVRFSPAPFILVALAVLASSCGDSPTSSELTDTLRPIDGEIATYTTDATVRVTEIHYDNDGTDTGEAIEIQGPAGTDLTGWSLVLYNGSSSQLKPYDTVALEGTIPATCAGGSEGQGVVVLDFPSNGIQNGSPDGWALVDDAGVVTEFMSYEGTFTAAEGPASGLESTDIGVSESSSTPAGHSLELTDSGWQGPSESSFGDCNAPAGDGGGDDGGDGSEVYLSELHYDNVGADEGEAFEVAAPAGTDLAGWSVVLYNGNGGSAYGTVDLDGVVPAGCGATGGLVFPRSGIQNGPDGLALVAPGGEVVEFWSYEGTFAAVDGPADGMTSTDMGVAETSSTAVGESLQRDGAGQPWHGPEAATFGCDDGGSGGGGETGEPVFLSEIRADQQGADSDEYVEVGGAAGVSLAGVTFIVIGDGSGGDGVIEEVTDLTGHALSDAGAFVMAESGFSLGTADLVTSLNLENGGNQTYLLVRGFTGANGQDLDTNDDGELETMPWSEVVDCVALVQYLGAGPVYCDARVGEDETSFTPGHSVRDDDGWFSAFFTVGTGSNDGNDSPGTLRFDPATAVAGQIAPWGVGAPGEPAAITVSATFVELPVRYNRALFVNVVDSFRDDVEGAFVAFTPADPAVVSVDMFGNLKAEGVGTTTVLLSVIGAEEVTNEVTVVVVPDAPSGVAYQDHLEFGEPADADPSDDIVIERDEYAVSYNPTLGSANWVSWNLDASHIGDQRRCECYTPDFALPAGAPQVVNFDYTGSGYSRGHIAQSFNRSVTLPDNAATYLTTNIMAQSSRNNGGPWAAFEHYITDRVRAGAEAYIIAGGEYAADAPSLKGEGKVYVPSWTWKVVVLLDRDETLADVHSLADLEVIAIRTPNRNEPGVDGTVDGISSDWQDYVVEVDEIEARTGYDLLALLPDGIESQIESGFDELVAIFDGLVGDGSVKNGASSAMGAQLAQAAAHLEAGDTGAAVRRLDQFLRLTYTFEANGRVTPGAAAALRAAVATVVEAVGAIGS